ncbi:MAG: LytTR family transcriptional regulator DNA-binding domain-containing protein [Lewinellaceae bacterium]|nr:LytTR family transcriptional regulator DNA-binding domain-containing protein [Lewinellaceae bacterium]
MELEMLEQTPFLSIAYDRRHFLYANWKGYVSVEQVKTGCVLLLETARSKNCFNWLNDNRQVLGTWTQAVRWLSQHFLPEIVRSNKLRIAFIYSHQVSARYSVDKLLEENDEYEAQTFESYELAEAWLLNQVDATALITPLTESVFHFRDHSRFYILSAAEINYIVANGKSILINTNSSTLAVKGSLESVEEQSRNSSLLRVHRSYFINVDKISHIVYQAGGGYLAYLKNQEHAAIPVSRKMSATLKKRLGIES